MRYEVTIAIPLYNAEAYIGKTMQAALAQTFGSIEFLLIDDCGTDAGISLVHDLQATHERGKDIRIVTHPRNLGVAAARNTAIEQATGKYLFFLDSDDLITPDCINLLHRAIEHEGAQVAIGSHRQIDASTGEATREFALPLLSAHEPGRLAALRFGELHHVLGFYIWNILYDLSFVRGKQLRFKNLHIGEDFVFLYDLLPEVDSFVLLPEFTYSYILRPNSLSQHGTRKEIPLSEIDEQVYIRSYGKQRFEGLKTQPYAADMVTNLMKYSFEAASYVVDRRKLIVPPAGSRQIRELLRHPLTLGEVWRLDRHRTSNLVYLLWSKLPYGIATLLLIGFLRLLQLSWRAKAMLRRLSTR